MRKKVIIGNWKMNNDSMETKNLLLNLTKLNLNKEIEVKVSPSFVNLETAQKILKNSSIEVVAQNMHYEKEGAYTGEISYKMLKSININSVIIGHSERRTLFFENNEILKKKLSTALNNQMNVIFCFGESLEDRNKKKHIIATSEGSAISIGIGHYLSTKKVPVVYMQNSGLGNCLYPLTSLTNKEL